MMILLEDLLSLDIVFFNYVFHTLVDVFPSKASHLFVPPKLGRFFFTQIEHASSLKETLLMRWKKNLYIKGELYKIHLYILNQKKADSRFLYWLSMTDVMIEERVKKIADSIIEPYPEVTFYEIDGRVYVDEYPKMPDVFKIMPSEKALARFSSFFGEEK